MLLSGFRVAICYRCGSLDHLTKSDLINRYFRRASLLTRDIGIVLYRKIRQTRIGGKVCLQQGQPRIPNFDSNMHLQTRPPRRRAVPDGLIRRTVTRVTARRTTVADFMAKIRATEGLDPLVQKGT